MTRHAPEVAAARTQQAVTDRCLTRRALSEAADQWHALVPVEQSLVMWQAVDHLARDLQGANPDLTLDQARVDALQQLVLGQADVTIHLHATHPAPPTTPGPTTPCGPTAAATTAHTDAPTPTTSTAPEKRGQDRRAGLAERTVSGVVELGGLGRPGTTTVDLDRLPATVRLLDSTTLTCHRDTGALLSGTVPKALAPHARRTPPADTDTDTDAEERYRPSPALQRLVRLRDGHCRFPGCRVPARSCDLDHVTAWPTGATTATNLVCLCRRHHRVKQRPGWSIRLDPDGIVHWTDPGGRRTTTAPVDHLDRIHHTRPHSPSSEPTHHLEPNDATEPAPPSVGDVSAPRTAEPMTSAALTDLVASPPPTAHTLAELTLARLLDLATGEDRTHPALGPDTIVIDCQFGPWNVIVDLPTIPRATAPPKPLPPPF